MNNTEKAGILAIGPLMIEHRLIDRMVALVEKEAQGAQADNNINIGLLGSAVDFFRFYADRCHHGKEEDILFANLRKKPLSEEHKNMLDGLLQDHTRLRRLVDGLDEARQRFLRKAPAAPDDIKKILKQLVEQYRIHIQIEDKQFFIPSMRYFAENEQAQMLREFALFDKTLIHEKYRKLVEATEGESHL